MSNDLTRRRHMQGLAAMLTYIVTPKEARAANETVAYGQTTYRPEYAPAL